MVSKRTVDLFGRADFIEACEENDWMHNIPVPNKDSSENELCDYLWAVFQLFNHLYYGDGLDMRRLYVHDFADEVCGVTCRAMDGSLFRQEVHINCSKAVLGVYEAMFDAGEDDGIAFGLADTMLHEMAHMLVMNMEDAAGVKYDDHGAEFENVCKSHGLECKGGVTLMDIGSMCYWQSAFWE